MGSLPTHPQVLPAKLGKSSLRTRISSRTAAARFLSRPKSPQSSSHKPEFGLGSRGASSGAGSGASGRASSGASFGAGSRASSGAGFGASSRAGRGFTATAAASRCQTGNEASSHNTTSRTGNQGLQGRFHVSHSSTAQKGLMMNPLDILNDATGNPVDLAAIWHGAVFPRGAVDRTRLGFWVS